MFCMQCGQQLPDDAAFCSRCGKKMLPDDVRVVAEAQAGGEPGVSPAESPMASPTPEPVKEPVPQPAEPPIPQPETEPTPQPEAEPIAQPATSPAFQPVAAPVSYDEQPAAEPTPAPFAGEDRPTWIREARAAKASKASGAPKAPSPAPSKKLVVAIAGVAIVVAILAVALFGGGSSTEGDAEIPDPEFYFALPLASTERSDGLVTYTIKANGDEDLSDQVYAYIDVLRNDYGFILNDNEESDGYINTHLFSDDALNEVQVIYLHDSYGNTVTVKTTDDVRLVRGVRYDGSSGSSSAKADANGNASTSSGTSGSAGAAASYATGDLTVLPDFAEFDQTGTFSYSTSFFASTAYDVDRLYFSYSSKDVSAVYQANRYVEMLQDLGWQIEFIDEDNTFYLYHPDVDAPSLPDAASAQIYIEGHVNSTGDTAFVSFMLPEEICIKNYEDKWQWNVEWRENNEREKAEEERNSSSSSSSSSGSSSSSSGSLNRDLYDNDPICGVCNGDGDCSKCGGSGYLYSSASDKTDRNCYKCNGSGNCGSCGGDGRL